MTRLGHWHNPETGGWIPLEVRRAPTGSCKVCGSLGALRRNVRVSADHPKGWTRRRHHDPDLPGEVCPGTGQTVIPDSLPPGWA